MGTGTLSGAICAKGPGVLTSISEMLCGSSEGFGHADRPVFLLPLLLHSSVSWGTPCVISK